VTFEPLRPHARPHEGACWRVVEAQHAVATLPLVDTLDEQLMLERLIEDAKPSVPLECIHLDPLLYTPFRYGVYPGGSRFRRAGRTPGVFYAATSSTTALAETAFHRLLFFAESPATPWPAGTTDYTAFRVRFAAASLLDLSLPPLDTMTALSHLTDYSASQALAEAARTDGIDALRCISVRDPDRGACIVLLTCAAFAARRPSQFETWRIRLSASGVQAISEHPRRRIEYDRQAFGADPRIAATQWER
jgi:hypothetical protein